MKEFQGKAAVITGAAGGNAQSVSDFAQARFAADERGSEEAPVRGLFI